MNSVVDGYTLKGGDAVSPRGIVKNASVSVRSGRIQASAAVSVDLKSGYCVYPALINVHDHLRGNYLPRVGPKAGTFYLNWAPWDADLKASSIYAERANITVEQMYFLGAYKNLFSGVVTVNDHFPHEFNEPYIDYLPIRVIRNYALAHECSSFDLKWGDGIEIEHARALERNWPFITHLEEGFDPESQDGIGVLERINCLDDHDVLVHCVGFSDEDIRKTRKANASVAWCPASNMFMFNVTCKIRKMLEAGINVSIGTDSTHTGSVNLLEEMRYARETYRTMYDTDLDPKTVMAMVTENPARAFRMESEIGRLEPGFRADIMVLRAKRDDPWENLIAADMTDIALLTMDGVPIYGEKRFADSIPVAAGHVSEIHVGGEPRFVSGNPERLLSEMRRAVGFDKKLDYLPFEPRAATEGKR